MEQGKDTTFLAYLKRIPDPRQDKGKQYEWSYLLAIIAAGLVSGYKTGRAIAHWARLHAQEILSLLGPARAKIPSPATFYRALSEIDPSALEHQIAAYTQALAQEDPASGGVTGPGGEVWYGQALDGKEIRGSRAHGCPLFLLSLVRHESAIVLGQARVAEKSNEITAAPALLAGRNLEGTVTTADALLTQRALAQQILDQKGHYLMVVKGNQPELLAHIDLLFRVPPVPTEGAEYLAYRYTGKGHGRIETRLLESSTALNHYLAWPGVGQVLRRTCRRVLVKSGQVTSKTTYGLTSLSREEAEPQQLEAIWRGHWTIENKVHYVRDETLGEDRGQGRRGSAPQALAALRNGVLSLLRHQGWFHIADALRYYGASVHKALRLVGAIAT
ncbi:MAG: ISAs1 family transposase [Candidatus Oleimicrobiaceae bacterium]